MDPTEKGQGPFECVDREIGSLTWRYREPDLDPELRLKIANHLSICDACRWDVGLEDAVAEGLRKGLLHVLPGRPRLKTGIHRQWPATVARTTGVLSGLALAASLALMFLLPPVPAGEDLINRAGADELRFVRPVESEIVLGGRPRLVWTALPGAVLYRIKLEEVGGPYSWVDSTRSTEIEVPADFSAPISARLRAFLEPVPADLAPPHGISVSFITGRFFSFVRYRVSAAPTWISLLALLTAAMTAAAMAVWALKRQ